MPRKYSTQLMRDLSRSTQDNLGIALAKACVGANLPAMHVANVFGVTRMTIHSWFRGGDIHEHRLELIKAFIRLVEKDTKRGILPAQTNKEAREYLADMTK